MFRRNASSKERKSVLTAPLPRRSNNNQLTHFTVLNAQQQQPQIVDVSQRDTETTSPVFQRSSNVHNLSFENESKKKKSDLCDETKNSHLCYCCEECRHCTDSQISFKRSRSSFVATIRKKFFSHKRSEKKESFEAGRDEPSSSHNRSLPRGWKSGAARLERSPSASSRRNRDDSLFAALHKHKQPSRSNPRASCDESPGGSCGCSQKKNQRQEEDPGRFHAAARLSAGQINQNGKESVESCVDSISQARQKHSSHFCNVKSLRPGSFDRAPLSVHPPQKTSAPDSTGYGHASPPDSRLSDTFDAVETDAIGGKNPTAVLPYYDKVKNPSVPGWSLTGELLKLPSYGWYWGPMSRTEAEKKLSKLPDGSFLVRDSSDDRHLLSLSFRSDGRTLHTRIEHFNGLFSFYARSSSASRDEDALSGAEAGCSSVVELIERSISDSQSGAFCYSRGRSVDSRSFPVCLSKPVSRFSQLATLQHMCRFVLRQRVRVDHLKLLPLPPSVKSWLEETQY